MSKAGICKFCGEQKELINAHIIPKNFYLDRKKTKFRAVNPYDGSWQNCQSGLFDKQNILCAECDNNILGIFDQKDIKFYLLKFIIITI